eukprot:8322921-Lingulodinium_polyedra.AAC.1
MDLYSSSSLSPSLSLDANNASLPSAGAVADLGGPLNHPVLARLMAKTGAFDKLPNEIPATLPRSFS